MANFGETARQFATLVAAAALGAALVPQVGRSAGPAAASVGAPFSVLAPDGSVLMKVEQSGDGARVTIKGHGSGRVQLGAAGGQASAISVGSQDTVFWSTAVEGDTIATNAKSGQNNTASIVSSENQVVQFLHGGVEVVNLGVKPGRNAAIRISSPSGAIAAQLGSNPVNAGAGTLTLTDAAGNVTGNWASKPDGTSILFLTAHGTPVFAIEPSKSGGAKVTLSMADGTSAVQAGGGSTGGIVCAYVAGKAPRCLDPTAP